MNIIYVSSTHLLHRHVEDDAEDEEDQEDGPTAWFGYRCLLPIAFIKPKSAVLLLLDAHSSCT